MKIDFFLIFIFLSFPIYASNCTPPPDNTQSLTNHYEKSSDVVLTAKLIAIEYDEAKDEKSGWLIWDITYVFEYKSFRKGNLANTQNRIQFTRQIMCDECDIKNIEIQNGLPVGNKFLLFANWVNEELILNNCAKMIQINN